jgi:hypothetical protein
MGVGKNRFSHPGLPPITKAEATYLGSVAMSDPITNEAGGGGTPERHGRSPFRYRRRRVDVMESVSPLRRPTLTLFRASTANVSGVLANAGKTVDTTLSWGRADDTPGERPDAPPAA